MSRVGNEAGKSERAANRQNGGQKRREKTTQCHTIIM